MVQFFRIRILGLYLLTGSQWVTAGDVNTDSLQTLLNQPVHDSIRLLSLNTLARAWRYDDAKTAVKLAGDAIQLATRLDHPEELAEAHNNMGVAYFTLGKYGPALEHHRKSMEIRSLLETDHKIADSHINIGNIYYTIGDNAKAVDHYFSALHIYEKLKKEKDVGDACNNIGLLMEAQNENDRALKYYFRSLRIYKALGDKRFIAIAYNNIGNVYDRKGRHAEALEFHNYSLLFRKELNDKRGMCSSYNNIGQIYFKQRKYPEAMEYLFTSLQLSSEQGDKWSMAVTYNTIGEAYLQQGMFEKARDYLTTALGLAREIGVKDVKMTAYRKLGDLAYREGDFREAYDWQQMSMDIKDSIINENSTRQIAEMEARYQNEMKENEIKLLKKNEELNRLTVYAISGGLLLMVIIALVAFNGLRNKRKANKILARQNGEISWQKNLIEGKNKDITDSIVYAQRIQVAMQPGEEQLQQYLTDSFVLYKPRDIVSGDFYWVESKAGRRFFAVVDCTGHGVPGAFMSIVGFNGLQQAVREYGQDRPSLILDHLNRSVSESLNRHGNKEGIKDGMDLSLCRLDVQERVLEYAGAYNSLIVVPAQPHNSIPEHALVFDEASGAFEIKADRHPIGSPQAESDKPYTNHRLCLAKGDMVFLFSDGYADQFGGPRGKKFKYAGFRKLLAGVASLPVHEQKQRLHHTLEAWQNHCAEKPCAQVDDICVMGVRIV